jgi:hypothetical protein
MKNILFIILLLGISLPIFSQVSEKLTTYEVVAATIWDEETGTRSFPSNQSREIYLIQKDNSLEVLHYSNEGTEILYTYVSLSETNCYSDILNNPTLKELGFKRIYWYRDNKDREIGISTIERDKPPIYKWFMLEIWSGVYLELFAKEL